jgi:hypothetical protein
MCRFFSVGGLKAALARRNQEEKFIKLLENDCKLASVEHDRFHSIMTPRNDL